MTKSPTGMTEPMDPPDEALDRAVEIGVARYGPNVTDEQLAVALDEVLRELIRDDFATIAKTGKAVTESEKRCLAFLIERTVADSIAEKPLPEGVTEAEMVEAGRAAWDAGLLRVETVRCGHGVKLVPVTSPVGMAH